MHDIFHMHKWNFMSSWRILKLYSNSLQLLHEGGCALGKAAAAIQFAIGRHKAPTDVPSAQLKTQKDGNYAPDINKDVRDSHEVQEKVEKKEQLTARQLRHRPERGQSAR